MKTATYRDLLMLGKASLDDPSEALILLSIVTGYSRAELYARLDDDAHNANTAVANITNTNTASNGNDADNGNNISCTATAAVSPPTAITAASPATRAVVSPSAATIIDRYIDMLNRRKRGEPIQYLAGSWEFMSLDFLVNRNTMIPRRETETLVEHLIEIVTNLNAKNAIFSEIRILDLCTGTGCVAISLAFFLPCVRVTGVDVSAAALDIARKNAAKNAVKTATKNVVNNAVNNAAKNVVKTAAKNSDKNAFENSTQNAAEYAAERPIGVVDFVECDVFNDESLDRLFEITGVVDIICSNPPYVKTADIDKLDTDVRDYEPNIALDGGVDGLRFYRRFADKVLPRFLSPSGFAAFEVGEGQADDVKHILCNKYCNPIIYYLKDIRGIDRVVCLNQTSVNSSSVKQA